MHLSREECPWCGTPNPYASQDATQTIGVALVSANGGGDTRRLGAQTVTLPVETLLTEEDGALIVDSPTASAPRGKRFWVRTYGWGLLISLLVILGFGVAGVLQGLKDRDVASTTDAITAYEEGRALVETGEYDLALAYFREAVRLEPNFPAAQQMLTYAEQQLAMQQGVAIEPTAPTATEAPIDTTSDTDTLFGQGADALAEKDWAGAVTIFAALRQNAPDYRPDEVASGLFTAYSELGQEALERNALDEALEYFDQALVVKPNDATINELRRLTSNYRTGLEAYQDENWTRAADQLRSVYVIEPDFLQTAQYLNSAHIKLANEFESREIWCDAAQNYRAALAIENNAEVAERAVAMEKECSVISIPSGGDDDDDDGPTSNPGTFPNATPSPIIVGTPVLTGTPTLETTATPFIPQATPTTSGGGSGSTFQYISFGVTEDLSASCFGRYLLGRVTTKDGTPLPGISLLMVDQYGNQTTAITKADPAGGYDFPISPQSGSYQVMIMSNGQVVSPPVTFTQSEAALQSQVACYTINWQQQ